MGCSMEINMVEAKRVEWIDVTKGLAIILVVLGHVSGISMYIRGTIFSFHMPLFFLVNGYLIKNYNVSETVSKSIKSLLKPYCLVCFIETVINAYICVDLDSAGKAFFSGLNDMVIGISNSSTLFEQYGSVWLVWFVICLFVCRNLYVIIMNVLNKMPILISYVVILFISVVGYIVGTRYAFLPWSIDVALYAIVFMAAGDMFRKHSFFEDHLRLKVVIFAGIWVLYSVTTKTYIELAVRNYPYVYGGAVSAISGSVVVIIVCIYVARKTKLIKSILSWYGKHSMLILGIHCIEMRFIPWEKVILPALHMTEFYVGEFVLRFLLISVLAFAIVSIGEIKKRIEKKMPADSVVPDRLVWPDIAKGLCMIAVIAGHMDLNRVNNLVYLWHLPVFFILAGYFYKKKPTRIIAKEKFIRLIIPYVLTCIVICFMSLFQARFVHVEAGKHFLSWLSASAYGAGNDVNYPIHVRGIGGIWFLWAMFFAVLIFNLLSDRKICFYVAVLLSFFAWLSSERTQLWLPLSIQAGLFVLPYLCLGYWYKNKRIEYEGKRISAIVFIFLGCISVWGLQNFKGFWLTHNYMGNGWIDFLASIGTSTLVIMFSKTLEKNTVIVSRLLSFFGKNSLMILCLHIIELSMFSMVPFLSNVIGINVYNTYGMTAVYILKVVYVTTGVLILNKIKLVRKIFN